jgi:hypothetical protein
MWPSVGLIQEVAVYMLLVARKSAQGYNMSGHRENEDLGTKLAHTSMEGRHQWYE